MTAVLGARPSTTIVILAWNAWEHTRACLDSLLPTLGPSDEVVVIDNGSADATAAGLAAYRGLTVETNPENVGFAAGCNQGAANALGDVVVFLNNDTLVFDGWLEELLGPFVDRAIGATGPRSNNVSGPQMVDDVDYAGKDRVDIAAFAGRWREANSGRTSETSRLVGFCLAVRRDLFEQIGGFDEDYKVGGFEDDDLCMKVIGAGSRLVIAHGAFVHHDAHVTFDTNHVDWESQQNENADRFHSKWIAPQESERPFLSVCMIVKDEEQMLPDCLASVAEVADEVVIYDTGSVDRTVEIARSSGATVIEGYWDNSFARARSAALEQATGEWVLSIDADEMLLSDRRTLLAQLSGIDRTIEAYLVPIENLHGAGNSRSVHTAIRMFRRDACTWRHRLHEQVVAADDPFRPLIVGYLSGTRILHRGYLAEAFESKNKAERNLTIARAALDDTDVSKAYALMNYGRTLELAGESEEAIDALTEAIDISEDPVTTRLALRNLIQILCRKQRFDEALEKVLELREASVAQVAADIAEGQIRIAMGDSETGLGFLARVPGRCRDDDGMEYGTQMVAAMRGEALASIERFDEAVDVVLEAIRTAGVLEADLAELISWMNSAGRPASEIARSIEVSDLMPVLARAMRLEPTAADDLLESIWERFPERLETLAAAARIAPRLQVARALVWSARLRRRGLAGSCPLVAIAKNDDLDPRTRILAGAAANGTFGERGVVNPVHRARGLLDPAVLVEVDREINRLAPELLNSSHSDPPPTQLRAAPIITSMSRIQRVPELSTSLPKVDPSPRRHGVNVVGPFEADSAEGEVARSVSSALREIGVPVSTTTYDPDRRSGPVRWEHTDAGDYPFETTILTVAPERVGDYVMDCGRPVFEDRYVMGIWLWDYDTPTPAMRTAARAFHEIWVPSRFAACAVSQITDRRVSKLALPLARNGSKPGRLSSRSASGPTFKTRVDYDAGFARQNPLGVVAAFREAFADAEGPRLCIETFHAGRHPSQHKELLDAVGSRQDMTVVEGRQAGPVDCFVSLHRSDGSGHAIAQAMASGTPTIATGFGANTEFQTDRDAYLVPFELEPVPEVRGQYPPGAMWAAPDARAAARAMRLVSEDSETASTKAQRAQERSLRLLKPSRAANALRDRIETVDRRRHADAYAPSNRANSRKVRVR